MWEQRTEALEPNRIHKVSILCNGSPLRYSEILDNWQRDADFRTFFNTLLADAPFPAYFWETPSITQETVDQGLEFVLVASPELAGVRSDPSAFQSHFESAHVEDGIVAFPNLGKDAFLIVPCPRGPLSAYPHIAQFVRHAPEPQRHALWRSVGRALECRLHEMPIWLSTAGQGVYWIHLRLDSFPKYYSYRPYRVQGFLTA